MLTSSQQAAAAMNAGCSGVRQPPCRKGTEWVPNLFEDKLPKYCEQRGKSWKLGKSRAPGCYLFMLLGDLEQL